MRCLFQKETDVELGSLLRSEAQSVYNQLLLYLSVSYSKVFSGLAMLASKDDTYSGPKDLKTDQHLVGALLSKCCWSQTTIHRLYKIMLSESQATIFNRQKCKTTLAFLLLTTTTSSISSLPHTNREIKENITATANKRSNGQNNSSARAFKAVFIFSCPMQNNSVKSPKFAWSENRNPEDKLFNFPFNQNINSFFIWRLPRRCQPDCPRSLTWLKGNSNRVYWDFIIYLYVAVWLVQKLATLFRPSKCKT